MKLKFYTATRDIRLRRSIAFTIDMFIIGAMVAIFDKLFPVTISSKIGLTLGICLAPVFYSLYFITFDIVAYGRTAGKSISRLVVVSKTGEVLSLKKRLLRTWYKMLGVLMLPPLVVVILFICDNHSFQDYRTGTRTIRSK